MSAAVTLTGSEAAGVGSIRKRACLEETVLERWLGLLYCAGGIAQSSLAVHGRQ